MDQNTRALIVARAKLRTGEKSEAVNVPNRDTIKASIDASGKVSVSIRRANESAPSYTCEGNAADSSLPPQWTGAPGIGFDTGNADSVYNCMTTSTFESFGYSEYHATTAP